MIWVEWHYSALRDERGNLVSILSLAQDVSSRIQAEERLQYMATHDGLTGLPNSVLLNDRLDAALARARRSGGRVGVMFLDLDHFKDVNDTLGHRVGDLLLKELARRIRGTLRQSDVLARVSGDEFVVVLEDFPDDSAPELRGPQGAGRGAPPVPPRKPRAARERQPGPGTPSRGRRRRGDAAEERRCRDVPRQGAGKERLPALLRRARRAPLAAPAGGDRATPGAARQRAGALLPADHRHRERRRASRRGAAALAGPGARPGAAAELHPARRGKRPRATPSGIG